MLFLLIKQCGHVYMHVFFVLTFCLFVCFVFWLFLVKKIISFLEFNDFVCKFDKNKNKDLLKKSFWEVINSYVLLAYASLAVSRTLLQRLLACLNFTLESENLSFWYKRKKWFLWTMAAAQTAENHGMKEAWPDIFHEGYMHQFQPETTRKIH